MFNFYIKGRVIEFKIDEGSNDVYIKLKQDDVLLEKDYLAYLFPHQLDNKGDLNNDGTSDKQKDSKNVNDKKYFCVDKYRIELSHDLFGVVKDGQEYIFEFEYDDSNNEKDKNALKNVSDLLNEISALLKNNNKCISVISCGYQDDRI